MSRPNTAAFVSPRSVRNVSRPWGASINARLNEALATRVNRAVHARIVAINAAKRTAK